MGKNFSKIPFLYRGEPTADHFGTEWLVEPCEAGKWFYLMVSSELLCVDILTFRPWQLSPIWVKRFRPSRASASPRTAPSLMGLVRMSAIAQCLQT